MRTLFALHVSLCAPPWGVLRQNTTHTSALAPLSTTDTKQRQTHSEYAFCSASEEHDGASTWLCA